MNFLILEPQQAEDLYVEQEKTSWWRNFKDGFRKRFRRRSDNYDSDSDLEESDDHGEEIDEDLILKGTSFYLIWKSTFKTVLHKGSGLSYFLVHRLDVTMALLNACPMMLQQPSESEKQKILKDRLLYKTLNPEAVGIWNLKWYNLII